MSKLYDLIKDSPHLEPGTENPWYANSVFRNIVTLPPRVKGSRIEKIVKEILIKTQHRLEKPKSTDYDMIMDGSMVEIKGSFLDRNNNPKFSFLQIRLQEYDAILFALFYPDDIKFIVMDKEQIKKNIRDKIFKPQHGGKKGKSGTYTYYGDKTTLIDIGGIDFKP